MLLFVTLRMILVVDKKVAGNSVLSADSSTFVSSKVIAAVANLPLLVITEVLASLAALPAVSIAV